MKNILLLTDFTEKSKNACSYALNLYKAEVCTFYVLSIQKVWEYTVDDFMTAPSNASVSEALLSDNKESLKLEIDELTKTHDTENFQFELITSYNVFTDAINSAISKYAIDLIVIGSDGPSEWIEAIFGSHTMRVIHKTGSAVLVIPQNFAYRNPKHIVMTVDHKDSFSRINTKLLSDIAQKQQSHITVLMCGNTYRSPKGLKLEMNEINQLFIHNTPQVVLIDETNSAKALSNYIKDHSADFSVIAAHHKNFIERLFATSSLSKMVETTAIPILILRAKAAKEVSMD